MSHRTQRPPQIIDDTTDLSVFGAPVARRRDTNGYRRGSRVSVAINSIRPTARMLWRRLDEA